MKETLLGALGFILQPNLQILVLQSKVGSMRRLRQESLKELDALLPAILDKAFKGEL
jgi:hypothetical protein